MPSRSPASRSERLRPLSALEVGATGVVARVAREPAARAERLAALGVTPGARVRVLQTFPGVVFQCDETEIAVEREVAGAVMVELAEQGQEAEHAAPASIAPEAPVATREGRARPRYGACDP
jgi:Fe2+ transport system protein FeoA